MALGRQWSDHTAAAIRRIHQLENLRDAPEMSAMGGEERFLASRYGGFMSDYVPTNRLRFVERHNDPRSFDFTSRILQQWWGEVLGYNEGVPSIGWTSGEWRDVPVENEDA